MNVYGRNSLLSFALGLLLSGCGAFHDKMGAISGTAAVSLNAFVTTVRPVLQSNCFTCHAQSGSAAAAAFFMHASDNDNLYSSCFGKIVVGNPASSLLLQKGTGNNHAGGNQLTSASDQDKIRAWIQNEGSGAGGSGSGGSSSGGSGSGSGSSGGGTSGSNLKFTGSVPIPTALTTNSTFKYMRFGLAGLGHAGAFVEVGVRYYTDASYEFSQWKVYSPNYPLKVTGVNVVVTSGLTQRLYNTLASVVLNAPQSQSADSASTPLPGTVLSSRAVPALEIQVGGDAISLGFTDVVRNDGATTNNSTDQAYFLSSVKPILLNSCASCHGNTNGSGNFNMPNNDDTVLYQNVRARVTPQDPANSRLLTKGTGGSNHGGGNRLPNQADRDTISNWINMINRVPFNIAAGTGNGAWATEANPLVISMEGQPFKTIRITNLDATNKILHAPGGNLCNHQDTNMPMATGQFYDCKIMAGAVGTSTCNGTNVMTYNHLVGTSAPFCFRVVP